MPNRDTWEVKRDALVATLKRIGGSDAFLRDAFLKMLLDEAYLYGRTEGMRQ